MVGVRRRWLEGFLAFLLLTALVVVVPGSVPLARAATLEVGITGCSDAAGTPYCTIQVAIGDANLAGGDVIQIIEDGTYNESLFIDRDLTIERAAPATVGGVTIDAGGADRVVAPIGTPTVTLRGLRLKGGSVAGNGAGVLVGDSNFTIEDSEIEGNTASGAAGYGGAIFVGSGSVTLDSVSIHGNSAERGGGIYLQGGGTLDVISSTISNNTANQEGGALYQQLGATTLQNVTFTLNGASTGVFFIGGGTATLRNTVAAGNTAGSSNPVCNGGGTITSLGSNFISKVGPVCSGVFTAPGDITGTPADPADPRLGPLQDNGGVGLSHVPESDSPLLDAGDNTGLDLLTDQLGNARTRDGIADGVNQADIGAVELDPLTVCSSGCDFATIEGPGGAQVAAANGSLIRLGAETFTGEFLRGNKDLVFQGSGIDTTVVDAGPGATFRVAQVRGGATVGIRDMTLTGGDIAGSGGGVSVFEPGSQLAMERVRVTGNTAGADGGGVENSQTLTIIDSIIDNNTAAGNFGGGVYTFGSGVTTIEGTTITANTANSSGGGVFTDGGTVNIRNSTITGNTATFTNAGGIAVGGGTTNVNNTTIWDNAAGATYESVFQFNTGVINFANSIIGEPASAQLTCGGTLTSQNFNILTKGDGCGFTPQSNDQVGSGAATLDPELGPLQDNGGPTQTLLPAGTSIAVDAGNNATCEITDQRGLPRTVGTACDVGSVEVQAAVTLQSLIDAAGPGATIVAPAGTFNENITIGDGKTLEGAGPASTIIDGGGGRTVDLTGNATLRSLQVRNGQAVEANGGNIRNLGFELTLDGVEVVGGFADLGGNIYSTGTLTMTGSTVSNGDAFVDGGGLYSTGSATLIDSFFINNDSDDDGGAIFNTDTGTLNVDNVTFNSNAATGVGDGGAIFNDGGDVNIVGSDFVGNTASDGAAIFHDPGPGFVFGTININSPVSCTVAPDIASFVPLTTFVNNDAAGDGGAIWAYGEVNVYETLFSANDADNGGAIFVESGSDPVTVGCSAFELNDATTDGGAIGSQDDGLVVVTDTLFDSNTAGDWGGAIVDPFGGTVFDVARSIFTNNVADIGGAVYSNYELTLVDSVLSGNVATTTGGAIFWDAFGGNLGTFDRLTIDGNSASDAGGMYLGGSSPFTLTNSTISNNTATSAAPDDAAGGIYADAEGLVENSTISGNQAPNGGAGGIFSGFETTLNNVTVTGNSSASGGGGLGSGENLFTMSNSIVADNTSVAGSPDCSGFIISLGFNVVGSDDETCADPWLGTDQVGVAAAPIDPLLGPLADNGGPTLTHDLLLGSPAIDTGNATGNISSPQFAAGDLARYQLNGSAAGQGGELFLAGEGAPAGSAFYTTNISTTSDFSAQFDFRVDTQGGDGADGFTFTITDDLGALGIGGGFLGLSEGFAAGDHINPINGVSVEFDTWPNGAAEGANDPGGLPPDHIGVDIDGDVSSIAISSTAGDFSNDTVWTAWIDYEAATNTLEVRASTGSRPFSPTLSTTVDIGAEFNGADAFVGFTGASGLGGLAGEQQILNFVFNQPFACAPNDQRGVVRPQGPSCDAGAVESTAVAPSELTVNITSAGAVGFATPVIAIDDLDIGTFFGSGDGPASTQLGAVQLGAVQLGAIAGTGLTAAGGHMTIGSIIDAAAELSAVPTILDEITLVDVPIVGGWESILALSADLVGRPPYTVSLQDVIDDAAIRAGIDPPLEEYRLADSGVTASQLGAIQLGAVQLGAIQLGAVQLGAVQLGAIGDQLEEICDDSAGGVGEPCISLGIDPTNPNTYETYSIMALTLLGVELDFAQLGAIQLGAISTSSLENIQLGAVQLGAVNTAAGTIGNTQLGAVQLGAVQLGAVELDAAQLGAIGTKADLVDYWCNDPLGGLNCSELGLDGSAPFVGDELDGYTLLALGAMGADLSVLQLGSIQLGAISTLNSSQLGAVQLGAVGDVSAAQLGAILLTDTQLGAIQLGAVDWTEPVFAQLGAVQLGAVQLGAVNADGSVIATQLGAIQLGAVQLGAVNNIVDCSTLAGGCEANATMTLLELQQAGLLLPGATLVDVAGALEGIPLQVLADQGFDIVTLVGAATLADLLPETTIAELPPDLTLAQLAELWVGIPVYELLLALLDPADLSWEDVDVATLAAENPVAIAGFSVGFELTGDPLAVPEAEFPFTADVSVTLPAGVSYVPGSSRLAVDPLSLPPSNSVALADPILDGATLRWIIADVELNAFQYLEFDLSTAFTADASAPIAATVDTLGVSASDSTPTVIFDVEPNDDFATAFEIEDDDVLILGRIDPGDDVDMFKLADVPAGASIEIYLNPGESDLDLVLFEPGGTTAAELRGPAERIVDGSLDPTVGIDPTEQDQESLADIANTDVGAVFKPSLHRDNARESIITPPLRVAGDYFIQVSGYQLPSSSDVSLMRVRKILPPAADACAARVLPFAGDGSPGALPAVPAGTETIYLINQELFADTYGAAALTDVLNAIAAVHAEPFAPSHAVIPVEGDASVASAYDDWLSATGNCDVDSANAVAQAIAELVDGYRADATLDISSVVIVGGDDQVPFFRVPDFATVANEREYATTFSGNNPLDAALRGGYVLTDAPFTDLNPLYVEQGDREIFVLQTPIGRLVEEPGEIIAALDQYRLSGGLLDMAQAATDPALDLTAEVLGYDFLSDSSANIAGALANQGFTVNAVINEVWDKPAIVYAYDSGSDVINANAHYDHRAALPAAGNASHTFNNLYTVDDLALLPTSIYAGSIIYTMGCHAGLNAPGAYLNPTDDLYDLAQALLGREAVFFANTGFGYGDSEFQAYSEELMALLTEQLGVSTTIGEAYTRAGALFAAQTPKWSPYHDKALMEATLYGLPFFALSPTPVTPPPIPTVGTGPAGFGGIESAAFTATSNAGGSHLGVVMTDDGNYYQSDDVLAVPFRPVQPLDYIEATPFNSALRIRGALIEGGESSELPNFDVLYARPILFDEDAEPEFETTGAFPNGLQTVTSYLLPNGRADRILLARGRYFPSIQTQQLWNEVQLTAYYGPGDPADPALPEISLVTAIDQGGGDVDFTVVGSDGSGIQRVLVLYKETGVTGAWTPLELTGPVGSSTGTWTGSAIIPAGAGNIDYWVQLLAGDGEVVSSTDKAELHDVLAPGPPTVNLNGTRGNNGIFRTSVSVALSPPEEAPNAPMEVSVDGGTSFAPYSGPVAVTANGEFTVVGRLAQFSDSSVSVSGVIDKTKPTITVVDPAPGVQVGLGVPLPLRFFCSDGQSGIAKCKGTVPNGALLDTSVVGDRTAQVTATDRAGNVTTVAVPYSVVAEEPVVITPDTAIVQDGGTVSFDAPGTEGAALVEWWFGDGNSYAAGEPPDVVGPPPQTHTYTEPGVYQVTVRTTAADGTVSVVVYNFIVVYDPTGGFVTGGGWFYTPEGAYTPDDPNDPTVTGKAHFGFSSKYKKGADVPSGDTTFKLDANKFKFESTSYEWLVVSGNARAQYKGVGTIKGWPGIYHFKITLRDADGNESDAFTQDAIRVMIWAEDGTVIYDNGLGVDDTTTHGGTQPIDGGSIVIHVPKGNGKK